MILAIECVSVHTISSVPISPTAGLSNKTTSRAFALNIAFISFSMELAISFNICERSFEVKLANVFCALRANIADSVAAFELMSDVDFEMPFCIAPFVTADAVSNCKVSNSNVFNNGDEWMEGDLFGDNIGVPFLELLLGC